MGMSKCRGSLLYSITRHKAFNVILLDTEASILVKEVDCERVWIRLLEEHASDFRL